ncbi:hypothetical protein OPV22_033813 [Ensete ventricosum]|uniref:Uncharacterized protein n=1 Tax=Ensete ventricosum TaxID=4639 RepID=A0AAV8Q0I7_ENSVE|nr:hypothetical protein OPV22_033813 [Ensete ventricosum]
MASPCGSHSSDVKATEWGVPARCLTEDGELSAPEFGGRTQRPERNEHIEEGVPFFPEISLRRVSRDWLLLYSFSALEF